MDTNTDIEKLYAELVGMEKALLGEYDVDEKLKLISEMADHCNKLNGIMDDAGGSGIKSEKLPKDISEQVGEEVVSRIQKMSTACRKISPEDQQKLIDSVLTKDVPEDIKEKVVKKIAGTLNDEGYRFQKKKIEEGWEKVKEVKTKTTDVRIRMSLDEKAHMQDNAERYGYKNLSEYIREIALSNPKKNPAAAAIYKYELSEDKLGLKAFFRSDNPIPDSSFYHIHSTEMTDDQRIIHELLLLRYITELESQRESRTS